MNHLLVGASDKTQHLIELAAAPFLLIDDGPIADEFLKLPHTKLFDITRHSFNPLRGIDYKRAREFATAVYTASPEAPDTLTVRNGKRALTRLLLANPRRLDKLPEDDHQVGTAEALSTVEDMLLSPVLTQVLCNPTNFSFKGAIVARLNRAEIGDFDAFLLAALLIGQCKGQIVVPDFGFYGRDFYSSLIRQNRLVASVTFLGEVSPKLQQLLLLIKDKSIYRTTREDAERLVFYTNHREPRNLMDLDEGEYLPG